MLTFVPRDPSGTPYQYDPASGAVRLSPATKLRYLKVPADYEAAVREDLARKYGPE